LPIPFIFSSYLEAYPMAMPTAMIMNHPSKHCMQQ
jgi:hypothetical protein